MPKEIIIKKDAKGITYLETAGQKMICPFRNVYMVPGRIQGQVEIHKETCNSTCPLFNINDNNNIELFCGAEVYVIFQDESQPG